MMGLCFECVCICGHDTVYTVHVHVCGEHACACTCKHPFIKCFVSRRTVSNAHVVDSKCKISFVFGRSFEHTH